MFVHREHEEDMLGECPGAKDLSDAEAVAHTLSIPFRVINFVVFYQHEVVDPMVEGYAYGHHPKPGHFMQSKDEIWCLTRLCIQGRL